MATGRAVAAADARTLRFALRAPTTKGGYLIREARLRAGLTQAELARRLRTSQSLVARWESGAVAPRFETVVRAIRACGLDLPLALRPYDADHDIVIEDQLRLSPTERARRMVALLQDVARLRPPPKA